MDREIVVCNKCKALYSDAAIDLDHYRCSRQTVVDEGLWACPRCDAEERAMWRGQQSTQ